MACCPFALRWTSGHPALVVGGRRLDLLTGERREVFEGVPEPFNGDRFVDGAWAAWSVESDVFARRVDGPDLGPIAQVRLAAAVPGPVRLEPLGRGSAWISGHGLVDLTGERAPMPMDGDPSADPGVRSPDRRWVVFRQLPGAADELPASWLVDLERRPPATVVALPPGARARGFTSDSTGLILLAADDGRHRLHPVGEAGLGPGLALSADPVQGMTRGPLAGGRAGALIDRQWVPYDGGAARAVPAAGLRCARAADTEFLWYLTREMDLLRLDLGTGDVRRVPTPEGDTQACTGVEDGVLLRVADDRPPRLILVEDGVRSVVADDLGKHAANYTVHGRMVTWSPLFADEGTSWARDVHGVRPAFRLPDGDGPPVWSADGSVVALVRGEDVVRLRTDGSDPPDGVVVGVRAPGRSGRLWIHSLSPDGAWVVVTGQGPRALTRTDGSMDGEWLAIEDADGRYDSPTWIDTELLAARLDPPGLDARASIRTLVPSRQGLRVGWRHTPERRHWLTLHLSQRGVVLHEFDEAGREGPSGPSDVVWISPLEGAPERRVLATVGPDSWPHAAVVFDNVAILRWNEGGLAVSLSAAFEPRPIPVDDLQRALYPLAVGRDGGLFEQDAPGVTYRPPLYMDWRTGETRALPDAELWRFVEAATSPDGRWLVHTSHHGMWNAIKATDLADIDAPTSVVAGSSDGDLRFLGWAPP